MESEYSAETAMRLARSGALMRILAAPDACEVCQAMASRVYLPSDVPRLPVRGCLRDRCRCTFVAVDPETNQTVPELVRWGARLIKQGRTELARTILRRALSLDERYELGWLWLSAVVDDETKIACLEKVLELDPHNERAAAGLESLRRETDSSAAAEPSTREPSVGWPKGRPPAAPVPVPSQVIEIRQERQVIVGQWEQFVGFAVNTDARTLLTQGRAFLKKLDDLRRQALSLVPPNARLQELRLQWQEGEEMVGALSEAFHAYQVPGIPGAREIADAVYSLDQQLRERQEPLHEQISARGAEP
jgi:hypothetical protein